MVSTNITVGVGDTNEVTIYSVKLDENITKKLTVIAPPQSTSNRADGPKPVKIVDLLRLEERISVSGHIDASNRTKLKNLMRSGGSKTWSIYGESVSVNMEKLKVSTLSRDQADVDDDLLDVTVDGVKGEDI